MAPEVTSTPTAPARRSFRVRTLMAVVAVVALALGLIRSPFQWVVLAFWVATFFAAFRIGRKCGFGKSPGALAWGSALGVLVALQDFAASFAYDTIGEVASAFLRFLTLLNVVPVFLWGFGLRKTAFALGLALTLIAVPEQMYLLGVWSRNHAEARRIIARLDAEHAKTGAYPADLAGYPFRPGVVKADFHYDLSDDRGYVLRYHVGSEGTSHDYSPKNGWFYYPD